MIHGTGHCPACDGSSFVGRKLIPHWVHATLTVLLYWTTGTIIWPFVWLLLSIPTLDRWRCAKCGTRARVG